MFCSPIGPIERFKMRKTPCEHWSDIQEGIPLFSRSAIHGHRWLDSSSVVSRSDRLAGLRLKPLQVTDRLPWGGLSVGDELFPNHVDHLIARRLRVSSEGRCTIRRYRVPFYTSSFYSHNSSSFSPLRRFRRSRCSLRRKTPLYGAPHCVNTVSSFRRWNRIEASIDGRHCDLLEISRLSSNVRFQACRKVPQPLFF